MRLQQLTGCLTGAEGNLRDLGALARVFVAREGRLLGALAGKMAGAHGGPAVFEVWMKQQSDLVQARSAPCKLPASGSAQQLQTFHRGDAVARVSTLFSQGWTHAAGMGACWNPQRA